MKWRRLIRHDDRRGGEKNNNSRGIQENIVHFGCDDRGSLVSHLVEAGICILMAKISMLEKVG